jgi:hypothetical protein
MVVLIEINYEEVIVSLFVNFVAFTEKIPEARLIHLETLLEIIFIEGTLETSTELL